jgi:hypothetical protein
MSSRLKQRKDAREGWGVRRWTDGSIYEGWFKADQACGRGRLIHADGYTYLG